jgi:hypothetical protein
VGIRKRSGILHLAPALFAPGGGEGESGCGSGYAPVGADGDCAAVIPHDAAREPRWWAG